MLASIRKTCWTCSSSAVDFQQNQERRRHNPCKRMWWPLELAAGEGDRHPLEDVTMNKESIMHSTDLGRMRWKKPESG